MKKIFITLFLFFAYCFTNMGQCFEISNSHMEAGYIEQSCFSGFYFQDKSYEGGNFFQLPSDLTDLVTYSLNERTLSRIGEDGIDLSSIYAPDYRDYEYSELDWGSYPLNNDETINFEQRGPKDAYNASTCKMRAYYHNLNFYGAKVTATYDFTGFLVGEDTLLTCAHGLWLDATTGILDDGINNMYFPGRIEVYGAIGLADEWSKEYAYYARATDLYMKSAYLVSREYSNDWAVLRLNKPLGKELGYRIITPYSDSNPSFRAIGYPTYLEHRFEDVPICGLTRNLMNNTVNYLCQTENGMSGAPIYNCSSHNENYTIDSHNFDELRKVYAMHVGYNDSSGAGVGVWMSVVIADFVDELNKKYRPESIYTDFSSMTRLDTEQYHLPFSKDYWADVTLANVEIDLNGITLMPTNTSAAEIKMDFDFPVSGISISFECRPQFFGMFFFTMSSEDFYGFTDTIVLDSKQNHSLGERQSFINFQSPTKSILFSFVCFSGGTVSMMELAIIPEWEYIPPSVDAPSLNYNEMISFGYGHDNDNNCVSYAIQRYIDYRSLCEIEHVHNHNGLILGLSEGIDNYRSVNSRHHLASLIEDEIINLGISFYPIDKYQLCELGYHKVALMVGLDGYYHFIRENSNGIWSHYFHDYQVYSIDSFGYVITDPENAAIVSLYNSVSGNENPWGNSLPIGSDDAFDRLMFYGYYSVENWEEE